ncbi:MULTISPECIES: DUF2586 domain-containing protein [unclassified Vibrio]|uniref:DUF2586 domain-containing protein n=1 Tax=unclassified Vibrio TaxID=2614977 RepID=UPI0013612D83|nr:MULTISPECIES: DUF2586 domain-containing protein [unclassified Vibrio]NAW58493.1 DUF2586 family protein [Vibrio sp. V36_P2S2PM302]NAX24965.1 DUF2586 family protein [Vibrio sp. V38_P2S17PM301]NAX32565.1 DUF2586 family protein [Vibrio sp. V37_P2S8PM304]
MALGKVQVDNINQYQNTPDEVERRFVFIGKTTIASLQNKITSLNAGTDLDKIFSETAAKTTKSDTDSYAYKDLVAAQLNAGQNWTAAFFGLEAEGSWTDALDRAIVDNAYESVVVCDPVTDVAALEVAKTKMAEVQSKSAQYMFVMMRTSPIDATPESGQDWAAYKTALASLVSNFVAERVMCVPTLFENDLGILAGRLCNRSVTVADSPMRTKTGTLLGMGNASTDKAGAPMPGTLFADLDALGYSVPQSYPGEKGWYWADGNTFDLETGDYKLIENLRVVLKACRQVYKIAIPTIADRSLNSTPQSQEKHKAVYRKPLLIMARAVQINGVPFPGEIQPPGDNAIEINWIDDRQVKIYITVRPYYSPKDITVGVGIDLSLQEG